MKNKKIFIAIGIFIILIFGIFLLNGDKGVSCHNLDWKDNPNEVNDKLSKLDLRYYDNGINKDGEKVDLNECISINDIGVSLRSEYIKSSSPSIKIGNVNLEEYEVRTIHDANQEIVDVREDFLVLESNYPSFKNNLKNKLLDLNAKYDCKDGLDKIVYKTKSNYIKVRYEALGASGLYQEPKYLIQVTYYNPKFDKEEILNDVTLYKNVD